jgi:glycosyltransferase involved in cell wall biosynthesis
MMVSIIIPCFNVDRFISECLEHALAQTYRPIEIIAVDNNSTDNTLTILRSYEQQYPALIRVLEAHKQGAPAARNAGLAVATGEWLQFLDADDLILPRKIEKQVELLLEAGREQGPVQVIGSYVDVFPGGKEVRQTGFTPNPFSVIAFSNLGNTIANLYNRAAVLSIGGWDESLHNGQDLDLVFKLLIMKRGGGLLYDPHFNAIYRHRASDSITSQHPEVLNKNTLNVRLRHFMELKLKHPHLFFKHKALLEDMVYFSIYRVGIYDVELADAYRIQYLGGGFKPSFRLAVFSFSHLIALNILGFKKFMTLRRILKKWLNYIRQASKLRQALFLMEGDCLKRSMVADSAKKYFE